MRMYDKSTDVFYSLSVQYGRCILEVCDICVWDPYVDTSGAFSTNPLMLMIVVLIFEVSQPAAPMIIDANVCSTNVCSTKVYSTNVCRTNICSTDFSTTDIWTTVVRSSEACDTEACGTEAGGPDVCMSDICSVDI